MTDIAVNQRSEEIEKGMAEPWPMIDALLGGTAAMRKAGRLHLPQGPQEDDEDYAYRLKTATLFPAYARTVGVMAGKPFSKQVTPSDDTPDVIKKLAENIDGENRSLHVFCAALMEEAVAYGFGGILVDYTRLSAPEGQLITNADARAVGARPYWVHIKHHDILGWRTDVQRGGTAILTQLRIAETRKVPDGEFGTKCVNRVRVHEIGSWRLYEEVNGAYTLVEAGTTTLKVIPFVPVYGRRVDFMCGKPPMTELAFQNVKHWQMQSSQDDNGEFGRRRLLVFTGLEDTAVSLPASSGHAIKLPVGADAKIIQGSAESVTVGREELKALEDQMIQSGAELLVKQPGARTATESANDAEANKCDLQRITENFEDALDQALQLTADWLGLPEGGHVSLFKDFGAATLSDASAQLIVTMQQGGLISKRTALVEQKRRGILAADIDPEVELEAAEADGPPLGAMTDPDDGQRQ